MATTYIDRPKEQQDLLSRWLARVYTVNWELVIYALIFVVAILTRFVNLGARVMSHDESLHTYYSWRLFTAGDYQHTPLMHGPILFHVTALMYFLFGDSDFTARLYPAILGVVLVMTPLLFRRWLGRWGTLLCSIGLLISPLILYYNRYIREDTAAYFSALLMVYAIFMYLDGPDHLRRRARWLYLLVAGMIWTMGTKETSFMYIAIFGSFLTLYWVVRLYQWARRQPAEKLFHFLVVGILVGALFALGMYMVITIGLGNYATLDTRVTFITQQIQAITSGQPASSDFITLIEWSLITIGIILAIVLGTAVWATRQGNRLRGRDIIGLLLIVLIIAVGLIAVEEKLIQPKQSPDAVDVASATISQIPIYIEYLVCIVLLGVFAYARFSGFLRKLYRFAEFDVLIVMGTLVLPWMAALFIYLQGADPTDYSIVGIGRAVVAVVPLLIVSTLIGLMWNWKRWLICALVFYIPFAFFFTTMFTNPQGLASGMIGSLGYWLEQQGVQRGSQPLYYYALVIMPVYEYLPIIGGFLAMLAGLVIFWRKRSIEPKPSVLLSETPAAIMDEAAPGDEPLPDEAALMAPLPSALPARLQPGGLNRPSIWLFIAWWAIFIFLAFTLAGEKMPWLGTHLTLPLIFLTAWYFGTVFEHVEWEKFRSRGWLYLILVPLLGVAIFQAISPFLVGDSPFQGLQLQALSGFYQWLAVVAVALLVIYLIIQVILRTGWLHFRRMVGVAAFLVLALLTFRTAYMASFINYDDATEYLVYAHGAPGIKLMMQQIQDVSERTTDGMNLKFAWGGNAWPVTWYFRHLTNATFFAGNPTPDSLKDAVMVYASDDINSRVEPLLGDNYYKFSYIRMWWPDQEYFYLNPTRVDNTLDFSASNTTAAEIRKGMFDIWWKRDYTAYGQAINKDYSLQNWPVSEKFYLYVRKDVAAQVWNLGTGNATVTNPIQSTVSSVCTSNWQAKAATTVFGNGQALQLSHPLDIDVDSAADRVYVANENSNSVSVFDEDGNPLTTIHPTTNGASQGSPSATIDLLNRPNGVAVAPDSNLYVADTWNYMIRELSPDGSVLKTWGEAGQYGANAQTDPTDGLWGPRDVTVDNNGNVYVADTGNKRVRVYDANGNFLRDIGSAGSALGQLDEPSGLAIDEAGGRLYVADTWNKRVSVFSLEGAPQFTFPVGGWYEDLGNRPYMAIDQTRHIVYVTDPDAGRVLVYDEQGNCLGSFGQPSDTPTDNTQFNTLGGIATDAQGNVYVVDAQAARVLKFAPFIDTVQPAPPPVQNNVVPQATQETTVEVQAAQSTPELQFIQLTEQSTSQVQEGETTPEATAVG